MKPTVSWLRSQGSALWTALNRILRTSLAALLCGVFVALAQDYGTDKPLPKVDAAVPLTPEQKSQLEAVDVRLAGVESLIAKVDDAAYKANCVAAVKDMRKKRAALEKNFDPASYETLMHSIISRYQVIALWLTPPRLPAPRTGLAKPGATDAAPTQSKSAPH